jgi:predicted DNA-binding protein (UPF0251 family)
MELRAGSRAFQRPPITSPEKSLFATWKSLLSIEELETIRLCDLLQIEPNEAADRMGISRKAFWNDLQNAGMSGNQSAMKDVPQTVLSAIPA